MTLNDLKQRLPAYAKDTKLNLGRVLAANGADGLNAKQVSAIALASAYATKRSEVFSAVIDHAGDALDEQSIEGAKAAATIMAMNNVYYRFVHLVSDKDYANMPANVRMNVIGNPGVDKIDFELMSLAVSAINGCGLCIDAHVQQITKAGVSKQGVQAAIRIAAVLNATAQALSIEQFDGSLESAMDKKNVALAS